MASWIADSSEIREIRAASGEQLPAVLGRLWRDRENASGRAAGSRLAEHYRRWDIAQRAPVEEVVYLDQYGERMWRRIDN